MTSELETGSTLQTCVYDSADLDRDAALFLGMNIADFGMWSRDLRFMGSDETIEYELVKYTASLRALSTLQCIVRAEEAVYMLSAPSSTPAVPHTMPRERPGKGPMTSKTERKERQETDMDIDMDATVVSVEIEVERIAAATIDMFLASLPQTISLALRGSEYADTVGLQLSASSVADSSFKQLKRDVERDCFVFNGTCLSGSQLGIDAIINTMTDQFDYFVRECGIPSYRYRNQQTKLLCERILRTACRTNSGGTTFLTLQQSLDAATSLIIPDSKRASPLCITMSIGNNYGEGLHNKVTSWGVVCKVTCSTVFSLCRQAGDSVTSAGPDMMEELLDIQHQSCGSVEGVYENVIFCDLGEQFDDVLTFDILSECVKFNRIVSADDVASSS